MQHKMIKQKRQLSDEQALELLEKGEYGIIATVGEDNQPYGVPISYVLHDNHIYCHCALAGHKLSNMKYNEKVSFTVVGKTQPKYEDDDFTTHYESTIVFGKATIVEDKEEKIEALRVLSAKYLPDFMDKFDMAIANSLPGTCVFKISIDHFTGKAKTEFN